MKKCSTFAKNWTALSSSSPNNSNHRHRLRLWSLQRHLSKGWDDFIEKFSFRGEAFAWENANFGRWKNWIEPRSAVLNRNSKLSRKLLFTRANTRRAPVGWFNLQECSSLSLKMKDKLTPRKLFLLAWEIIKKIWQMRDCSGEAEGPHFVPYLRANLPQGGGILFASKFMKNSSSLSIK